MHSAESIERARRSAIILRAAAHYIERHGYYISRFRLYQFLDPNMESTDLDWYDESLYDYDDTYDRTYVGPTPPVSETAAIAMIIYGWPNTSPINDGSNAYLDYCDAVGDFNLSYAPDGDGLGDWIFPHQVANDMRRVADERDRDADQQTRLLRTWGE